jgi:hypothetical protein
MAYGLINDFEGLLFVLELAYFEKICRFYLFPGIAIQGVFYSKQEQWRGYQLWVCYSIHIFVFRGARLAKSIIEITFLKKTKIALLDKLLTCGFKEGIKAVRLL